MAYQITETGAPNLDCMTQDDLWEFHMACRGVSPRRVARALFPTQRKGAVTAVKDLRNYAANKATAMSCRLRGEIETALMYERIADGIYDRLPEWARW